MSFRDSYNILKCSIIANLHSYNKYLLKIFNCSQRRRWLQLKEKVDKLRISLLEQTSPVNSNHADSKFNNTKARGFCLVRCLEIYTECLVQGCYFVFKQVLYTASRVLNILRASLCDMLIRKHRFCGVWFSQNGGVFL